MKSFKRLISILVCLAMLSCCVLVQADNEANAQADIKIVYGTEEVGLTNALAITEYAPEDLEAKITRGEFYALIAKASGYPGLKNEEVVFSDFAPGAEFEEYAKTLYKAGIITPDGSGKVYPDGDIGTTEAIALLMKILGYGPKADAIGGYPAGYLMVANTADVSDGIDTSIASMTKGLAVELIYNALHADMMVQSVTPVNGSAEYRVSNDTNLLNTVFGVGIVEGAVDGVDISRVIGLNDVNPFHIEVGGVTLESRAIANPYSYLGYDVEAYYTDERHSEPKVIYMAKTDLNEEHIFDVEDIVEVSGNKVRAYDATGKKQKNYSFIKGVPVIFNGVATKQAFSAKLWEGLCGTVRLLDNTGDGTADVVFVEAYENFIISHYDSDNKTVYYKGDSSKKLVLDNTTNDPYVILYDAYGEEIQPGKLAKDVVVSLYHSAPDAYQQYVRAYLSSDTVTGEIEEVLDGGEEIVVDGITYEVNKATVSKIKGLLKPGTAVVLYLDYLGKVADASIDTGLSFEYGFVVAAGTEGALDSVVKFIMYRTDRTRVEAYAASNIRVDGVRYASHDVTMLNNLYSASAKMHGYNFEIPADVKDENGEVIYSYDTLEKQIKYRLENKCPVGSVVRFSINSNGKINAIDTIMHNETEVADRNSNHSNKNSLFAIDQTGVYYRAYSNHRTIGPKVVLSADAMIMYYPQLTLDDFDAAFDDDNYLCNKFTSSVAHNDQFKNTVWAFYSSGKQIVCDFIATPMGEGAGSSISESTKIAIMDYMSKSLDPVYGETEVDCINLISDSGKVKIPIKPGTTSIGGIDVATLSKGDVLRFGKDYQGYLNSLQVYYKPSDGTTPTTTYESAVYSSTTAIRRGYVYQSFKEGVYVYFNNKLTGDFSRDKEMLDSISVKDCEFVYHSVTTPAVYKYEKNELDKFQVSGGSAAGLKSYLETGEDCSFVIIHTYNGQPWGIAEYLDLDIPEQEPDTETNN